jgi:Tol biopolymer transport system component/tRNA A-37 threonylcarbamoyl transferase component Bud32
VTQQTDRLNTALAGRYHIERHLGEGGMASVYLCEDLKHKRKVALKLLKPELAAVLGAERFVQEITTTASLQHPHILPLFDSGTADGFLFYVMPYIQGETLREKLNRETQLGVDEAVRIAREVADALDYAHRNGVIHRDIKPENILLHDGRPMVADFGIALAVSAAAGGRMTETGLSLGTPHYMSPEQATAEKEITARADIYSLGSVLYEMLTGSPPHVGANAQQIIMKIITEPAEPVTKYRKAVPPNVAAAVAKSLEKLPADRFDSAKAFADALVNPAFRDETMVGVGVGARHGGGNRWLTAAATVVALAVGIAIGALLMRRPPVAPQVVRFTMPMKGQRLSLARGADAPFALSPDGTRIAYVATDSGASAPTLHVRSLDQFTTTTVPGTDGALVPFFSPDGLWIGFVTLSSVINKVAASGGPVSPLVTGTDRTQGAPSWGDDHSIVYTTRGILTRVRDGGGAPTILADSMQARGFSPAVLPGSRALLAALCPRSGSTCNTDLGVLDVATGKSKVLVPGATRGWYLPSGHLVYATRQGALFAVKFDLKSLAITSAPVGVLDGIELGTNAMLPRVAISPSGTMAYLAPGGGASAVIVQVDRGGREQVIVAKPGAYSTPRLSPDGRLLVLGNQDAKDVAQIWIHDRSSGTTRQLTFDGTSIRPAWSPDGKRVAFSAQRAGRWNVWSAPADGSGPEARVGQGPEVLGAAAVSWTRDGKWIVFDGPPEDGKGPGGEDVFAIPMSAAPHTMRPAVASRFDEQSGEVSPDGKWIAYASNESGKYQIYIQPFLAPGGRTLISAGLAAEPAWVSNNELAFVNVDTDSLTLAHLEFGATIKVTRTALFDRRPYLPGSASVRHFDVSRDGKSFVFVKPLTSRTSVEPVVVLNWMEEVKRLMAAAGIR